MEAEVGAGWFWIFVEGVELTRSGPRLARTAPVVRGSAQAALSRREGWFHESAKRACSAPAAGQGIGACRYNGLQRCGPCARTSKFMVVLTEGAVQAQPADQLVDAGGEQVRPLKAPAGTPRPVQGNWLVGVV